MPRIYYNPVDETIQRWAFLVHAIVFVLGSVWLGIAGISDAILWTTLWTVFMTLHSIWHAPLPIEDTALQYRTYDRLRNRFGRDWDLAATDAEYNHEQAIARLEAQHKRILPEATPVLVAIAGIAMILFVMLGDVPWTWLSANAFGWGIGWSLMVAFSQWRIAHYLRPNKPDTRKKDAAKTPQSSQHLIDSTQQRPRVGMTYAVGDDGELVEVPLTQETITHKNDATIRR